MASRSRIGFALGVALVLGSALPATGSGERCVADVRVISQAQQRALEVARAAGDGDCKESVRTWLRALHEEHLGVHDASYDLAAPARVIAELGAAASTAARD